ATALLAKRWLHSRAIRRAIWLGKTPGLPKRWHASSIIRREMRWNAPNTYDFCNSADFRCGRSRPRWLVKLKIALEAVVPAKAGTHSASVVGLRVDSRFHGNDGLRANICGEAGWSAIPVCRHRADACAGIAFQPTQPTGGIFSTPFLPP